MRKIFTAISVIVLLSACHTRKLAVADDKAKTNNTEIINAANAAHASYTVYTADSYIQRFKAIAIQEMKLYNIPASITLAQGLYESGNGNSDLARYANNHFGIKCNTDWTGKSYYKDDDAHNDCFRVYNTPEDSYRDHSVFLQRKRYAALYTLDITDYRGWANGLKAAGYATNPHYPDMIINIIQKYNLDQYDGPAPVQPKPQPAVSTPVTIPIQKTALNAPNSTPANAPAASAKTYTVKQGDTLYNISKRFGLTVDLLKALNNLTDNGIKIGQALIIAQ